MNWKTWTTAGLIIIVLFAIYTFAAPESRNDPPAETAVRTTAHPAGTAAVPSSYAGVETIHTEWLDAQTGSYKTERNLFAYKEPPPPPPPPPPKPTPPPPPPPKCPDTYNPNQPGLTAPPAGDPCYQVWNTAHPPPPPPPVPPPFDYKYIGTFGSPRNLIATFNRSGEIVNVRVGDTIDGKFVLRNIGLESVDIGFVGFPPNQTQRVPLGQ